MLNNDLKPNAHQAPEKKKYWSQYSAPPGQKMLFGGSGIVLAWIVSALTGRTLWVLILGGGVWVLIGAIQWVCRRIDGD